MKKVCSIHLLWIGIFLSLLLGILAGFLMGTGKNWQGYEERIALLEEEKELLQQTQEEHKETLTESFSLSEPYEYILLEEDGYVSVYHTDRKTRYADTDIILDRLPKNLQKEIKEGKYMNSEDELYQFLENYSS